MSRKTPKEVTPYDVPTRKRPYVPYNKSFNKFNHIKFEKVCFNSTKVDSVLELPQTFTDSDFH